MPPDGKAKSALSGVISHPGVSLREDELEYVALILLAIVVGVLSALGNLGFRELIAFFSWVFRGLEWDLLGIGRGGGFRALIPLVLISGGVLMLVLERVFPGDALGYGFPNFLEQVNLGDAKIRRRWIVVKALGAALSLGAGASVGREGPIAQIGGAIGSALSQFRHLSPSRAKLLVAAGAGAGIATTFNAPIGGLMFAWEIVVLGETEIAGMTLLIVATFSAVLTERAIMGNAQVFHPQVFVLRSYFEMLTYAVMGAALGLLSAGFIRFFHAAADVFRRSALPQWLRLFVGLAIVGAIAIALPDNLSDGYPIIDKALAGEFALMMLAALTAAKFFATGVSLGCGAPGGVFGPIFFIGTMAGGAFQQLSALLLPRLTGPRGSYALVGLGGFLAGTTHAPLTALFLLEEMTRLDFNMVLPAMITIIAALLVSRAIERESIDTYALARQGKTLEIGRERLVLTQIPVESVMTKEVATVAQNASINDVMRAAGDTEQATLPVVDEEQGLIGVIVTRDLLASIAGGEELGPLVNAWDLARRNTGAVAPAASLDEATQMMEHESLDELPVVDRSGLKRRLVGLVTRRAIARTFNRVSVSLSSLAARDTNIFWAGGYHVRRIAIPAAAAGRTVVELNPRARFGVTVLAVQSADDPAGGFVPITPDRRFKRGDVVIAAGRAASIRQFARALETASAAE